MRELVHENEKALHLDSHINEFVQQLLLFLCNFGSLLRSLLGLSIQQLQAVVITIALKRHLCNRLKSRKVGKYEYSKLGRNTGKPEKVEIRFNKNINFKVSLCLFGRERTVREFK